MFYQLNYFMCVFKTGDVPVNLSEAQDYLSGTPDYTGLIVISLSANGSTRQGRELARSFYSGQQCSGGFLFSLSLSPRARLTLNGCPCSSVSLLVSCGSVCLWVRVWRARPRVCQIGC